VHRRGIGRASGFSREGKLKDVWTFYFCEEHKLALYDVDNSRTLPPEDWFAPGYVPQVRTF
jgi:hypothetical protein